MKIFRRLTAFVAAVAIIVCQIPVSAPAVTDSFESENVLVGDVDQNGVLDTADARYVMCILLGMIEIQSDKDLQAADTNRDGLINSVDVRRMLLMIIYLRNETVLYSFAALSDLHLQYATGQSDFARALAYFDKKQIPFSCVCGDLTWAATMVNADAYTKQWKGGLADYKDIKADYPVYAIGGNHETYTATYDLSAKTWKSVSTGLDIDLWKKMTGNDPFFTVSNQPDDAQLHNVCNPVLPDSDVFIMLSVSYASAPNLWLEGEWEWLQTTLEANKHKRCYVFFHQHDNEDRTADPFGLYPYGISESTAQGKAFIELMRQYRNTIWFHGHTHTAFSEDLMPVEDGSQQGYTSVHIPSLQGPRSWNLETGQSVGMAEKSQCYVVDVYANRIVLKALDMTTVQADGTGEAAVLETYTIYTTC